MARYRVHLYIDLEAEEATEDSAMEAADAALYNADVLCAQYLSIERLPSPAPTEDAER